MPCPPPIRPLQFGMQAACATLLNRLRLWYDYNDSPDPIGRALMGCLVNFGQGTKRRELLETLSLFGVSRDASGARYLEQRLTRSLLEPKLRDLKALWLSQA